MISKSLKEFIQIGIDFKKREADIKRNINNGEINEKDIKDIRNFMNAYIRVTYNNSELIALLNRYKSKIDEKKKIEPNFKPEFDINIQQFIKEKEETIKLLGLESKKGIFARFTGEYKSELLEIAEKDFYGGILNKDVDRLVRLAAVIGGALLGFKLLLTIIDHTDKMF